MWTFRLGIGPGFNASIHRPSKRPNWTPTNTKSVSEPEYEHPNTVLGVGRYVWLDQRGDLLFVLVNIKTT